MTPLDRGVDVLETIGTARDDGYVRLIALGEAAVRLVRPLHRRPRAIALRKSQVVAHTELVAVAENRRARQREYQAVGELQASAIAIEHGSKPSTNAAVVEPHPRLRSDRRKHLLPLPFSEPAKIELVMIAQEHAPLSRGWARPGRLHGIDQRARAGRCERIDQVL